MRLTLETPLAAFSGTFTRIFPSLARMGIRTVRDVLFHFPSRYEDFSAVRPIAALEAGERATVQGTIMRLSMRRSWRKRFAIIEADIADESGGIRAVWFNQPYLAHALKNGFHYNFSGKVSENEEGGLCLNSPAFEFLPRGQDDEFESGPPPSLSLRHTGRLVPIYPETKGVTSKGIRALVHAILARLAPLPEFLPLEVRDSENLPELNRALRAIHFPDLIDDAHASKRRFAFEDLFLLQLANLRERLSLRRERAPAIPADIEDVQRIAGALPFALTASQKKALLEIIKDLREPFPMNRILQGDVGSGKTAVAAIAALLAARAGLQTAVMAPTEVLARQHYETFKKLVLSITPRLPVALLTSRESRLLCGEEERAIPKTKLKERLARGEAEIAIGTHALLSANVTWHNLGLAVIDEQHRFGVRQRARLVRRASPAAPLPHFLSMSATPIPRTLMLTVFGDLDASAITELPPGRKTIRTYAVPPEKRPAAYEFIRTHIKDGRQAFVICPRIQPAPMRADGSAFYPRESAASTEVKTVTEEYEKLSQKIFPDLRVAMLHGKIKSKEKEAVMRGFREGGFDILVSTTVIEVGVDVPNASIMMIEGSDRFGLAQLYQLRGRVGRGAHESYCLLFTDSPSKSAAARLKAIIKAKNGFELAEQDLKLRGPGEFLGEAQTGFPDAAMEALADAPLISASREAAKRMLRADPALAQHFALKKKLEGFERALHRE